MESVRFELWWHCALVPIVLHTGLLALLSRWDAARTQRADWEPGVALLARRAAPGRLLLRNLLLSMAASAAIWTVTPLGIGDTFASVATPEPLGLALRKLLVGFVFGADLVFYVSHRLLHTWPALFRLVHARHHESRRPMAGDTEDCHWLELLTVNAPTLATAPTLLRFSYPLLVWTGALTLLTALEHTELLEHHAAHHALVAVNYGLSPTWDALLGTRRGPPLALRHRLLLALGLVALLATTPLEPRSPACLLVSALGVPCRH